MKNQLCKSLIVLLSGIFLLSICANATFAETPENNESEVINVEVEDEAYELNDVEDVAVQEEMEVVAETVEKPPVEEIDSQSSVYYTVKKGDTLWDLSRRFSNDSWQWPGMWGHNEQIKNPHRIYPGQRIKLFKRSDIEQIKKLEEVVTNENVEEVPEFVEPEETEKVVETVDTLEIEPTPEAVTREEAPINLPFYHYSGINSVGFMKKEAAESHGYIFKVKGIGRIMLSKGDEVYIKESEGISLTPGAKYHTYETNSPSFIKQKLKENKIFGSETKKTAVGTQHVLTGVVEITGKKSGYAIAKIIKSYRTIRLKNFVIPYVKRSPEITLSASVEGLNGQIISDENHQGMFGDNTVAFIDKGSSSGIKTGQMYNVYYPEKKDSAEFIGGDKLFIPVDFASFIVLHTEENTSTVFVTSSYKSITAGDMWHYPQE